MPAGMYPNLNTPFLFTSEVGLHPGISRDSSRSICARTSSPAWLLSKPGVTAPVVGVSKVSQVKNLIEGTELTLEQEDINYLEELYEPVENLLSIGTS